MKTKLIIISILFSFSLASCKKEKASNTTQQVNVENSSHCFLYNMDNSYVIDNKTVKQTDLISINLVIKNNKVTGEYKILSNEETINIGHFIGEINTNIITTIHTYNKGNEAFKDELVFKMDEQEISILGGEKKLVNGVNMFVDKSKCDYMMQLPRVDCK